MSFALIVQRTEGRGEDWRAGMKKLIPLALATLLAGGMLVSCDDASSEVPPQYEGRSLTEWTGDANDLDPATRLYALIRIATAAQSQMKGSDDFAEVIDERIGANDLLALLAAASTDYPPTSSRDEGYSRIADAVVAYVNSPAMPDRELTEVVLTAQFCNRTGRTRIARAVASRWNEPDESAVRWRERLDADHIPLSMIARAIAPTPADETAMFGRTVLRSNGLLDFPREYQRMTVSQADVDRIRSTRDRAAANLRRIDQWLEEPDLSEEARRELLELRSEAERSLGNLNKMAEALVPEDANKPQ